MKFSIFNCQFSIVLQRAAIQRDSTYDCTIDSKVNELALLNEGNHPLTSDTTTNESCNKANDE